MEQTDTRATDSEEIDRALADISESPSAIERQIAAAAALRDGNYSQEAVGGFSAERRVIDYNTERRKPHHFRLGIFLVVFLLVAAALAWVFTDIGRPLQKAFNAAPQMMAKQIAAKPNPSPTINAPANSPPAPTADSSPTAASTAQATGSSQAAEPSLATNNPVATTNQSPANEPQTVAPKNVAEVASPAAVSIPIADVSLRNRPELLEQVVQVYRAQLAKDPNDATALAALNQLRERSLSELETIIAAGDDSTTVKSLAITSRLFPELTDNPRYKNLLARMDNVHREQQSEPAVKPEQSAPSTTVQSEKTAPVKTVSHKTIAPAAVPAEKTVSSAVNSSPAVAKKPAETATSSKPEIRAVSIMPGTMIDGRFVPRDGGNVFMVELSYSNFSKAFIDKDEATLVAQLGVPEDSMVLAEVPVTISADRGTKSFAMETTGAQGYAGGKFQLEFMLNDAFLASRTVRLSRPAQ